MSVTATPHPMNMPLASDALSGKSIVVTGAGQGIGRAISELCASLGANVAMVDMNAETLAEAQKGIGDQAKAYVGDVSDAAFVENTVSDAISQFGGVHGLVNNAGITRPAMLQKMTLEQWQAVLNVHLTGAFLFTQAVGHDMIARAKAGEANPGSIVCISSDAGVQGTIGQINYATCKAGIMGFAMSTAREWGKYGIRANTVAFGMVETPMTEKIRTDEKLSEIYMARIILQRASSPQEAAVPICFLLSDGASYITGQRISVNGGSQMAC